MPDSTKLSPGVVPQTVFWAIDDHGEAIGFVRMRHYLNESLKDRGGHIGYYLRKDKRGNGYGTIILQQALAELRKLGEQRALLTVNLDNTPSIKVIEGNGGVCVSEGQSADGQRFGRFWIDLGHPPAGWVY